MAYLEIKNLVKKFSDSEAVKGVNLSVEKGEVVSIIGHSGSGKTTLLRCLNLVELPTSGQIILGNEVLFDDNNKDEKLLNKLNYNLGMVFQSFNLFPQYSVLENVMLAAKLQLGKKTKEYLKELKKQKVKLSERLILSRKYYKEQLEIIENEALEIIDKMNLTSRKDAYPCELSGGQSQRVAIARALMLKPTVLCFDEPTSALDPELTHEVLNVILSLKSEDRAMIIVTHEMDFARDISDKIVFMADGNIVEEGTPEEIFTNPKTETLQQFLSNYK